MLKTDRVEPDIPQMSKVMWCQNDAIYMPDYSVKYTHCHNTE